MPKLALLLGVLFAAGPSLAQVRTAPAAVEGPAVPGPFSAAEPALGSDRFATLNLVPVRLDLPALMALPDVHGASAHVRSQASPRRPAEDLRSSASREVRRERSLGARPASILPAASLRNSLAWGSGEERASAETANQAASRAFDLNGWRESLAVEAPESLGIGVRALQGDGRPAGRRPGLNAVEPPPPAPKASRLRPGLIIGLGVAAGAAALWIFAGASGLATAATSAGVGLLLGMRHATDADHVIAVANVVSRAGPGRGAWKVGAVWGLGHTATLLVVGGAIILLKASFPPSLASYFEAVVAGALVILGLINMANGGRRFHGHDHRHALPPGIGKAAQLKALGLGLIHGLAGSAAVALLILATIPSRGLAMVYLATFGLGTVAGMTLMTVAMGYSISWLARRGGLERRLAFAAGLVSLLFGLYMLYHIGIVDGLFL